MDRLDGVMAELRAFVAEREWGQFHDPKNLAMAVGSEAGELLAEYRWVSNDHADTFSCEPDARKRIAAEVADVGIALLLFCDRTGLDLIDAVREKLVRNRLNYPVELSRGRSERPRQVVRPIFDRYVGIDYSGAETPTAGLTGLRVYMADRTSPPTEVQPPPSPRTHWTRRGIAEWLASLLTEDRPTLVGIDHGFSFPLQYFKQHDLPHAWPAFLDDFQRHWPTDEDGIYVQFVRDGAHGQGAARSGNPRWRRLTELRAGAAKSVFHFDVQGSVAKSTHAGLPWLRYIRQNTLGRVHFWPFDGWEIPAGRSVVAEVYPSLWKGTFTLKGVTRDQQDAYAVAAWMRQADLDGSLSDFFTPPLTDDERKTAEIEGWILGIK
jgi:hypothetical protein